MCNNNYTRTMDSLQRFKALVYWIVVVKYKIILYTLDQMI